MSEEQSYTFDFQRVSDFFDRWNVNFKTTSDFGVANKFQICLCSYAPDTIEQCLTGGVIDISQVSDIRSQDCRLDWVNEEIVLNGDVTFNLSTSIVPIKAVFIRHKASGVVLGYCIDLNAIEVTNKVIFDDGTIFWSIKDGE